MGQTCSLYIRYNPSSEMHAYCALSKPPISLNNIDVAGTYFTQVTDERKIVVRDDSRTIIDTINVDANNVKRILVRRTDLGD